LTAEAILQTKVDSLPITVYKTNEAMGEAAALEAAEIIKAAIKEKGAANIIIATGNSQLTFLETLRDLSGIDWSKVTIFHMDEYIDLPAGHPASFPTFLQRHLLDHIPAPAAFYPVIARVGQIEVDVAEYVELRRPYPPDLFAMGIAENGTLPSTIPPSPNLTIPYG